VSGDGETGEARIVASINLPQPTKHMPSLKSCTVHSGESGEATAPFAKAHARIIEGGLAEEAKAGLAWSGRAPVSETYRMSPSGEKVMPLGIAKLSSTTLTFPVPGSSWKTPWHGSPCDSTGLFIMPHEGSVK